MSKSIFKILFKSNFVLFVLMLLTGCASVPELQQQLANSTHITNSYHDMNYNVLENSKSQTVELNSKSPTFMFEEGKSYYSALTIPAQGLPHKLNIKTYLTSGYLPSTSVLVPNFLFLDLHKNRLKMTNNFRLDPGMDFWLGGFFGGYVVVPSDAVYLIVYANNSSISNLTTHSENGREWPVPYAPAGKLSLELSEGLSSEYNSSTAKIKDSIKVHSNSKADFFFISEIDGKKVENSLSTTRRHNAGKGLNMTPDIVDRNVEVKAMTISIVGRTHYAAPIQALTNPVFEVKGKVTFIPEKNMTYVVVGELNETNSTVWIEESITHKVMGDRIESHDSKLGIMQK